jgi:hypothetical protein
MNVDEIEMDELYETEDELIRLYRRLDLTDQQRRQMVNITKDKFRGMRAVIRYREALKKELKNNG